MPLTNDEKQRVRYHLGYPALTDAASVAFGVPTMNQTNFLVQSAMDRLLESSLEQVRKICAIMDGIDERLIEAQERLAATQLEELHLRDDEPDLLDKEYRRWGYRLSDILGSPVYPFSQRYRTTAGNTVTSIPISRGI